MVDAARRHHHNELVTTKKAEAERRLRAAIDDLSEAIAGNLDRSQAIQERLEEAAERLEAGDEVPEIVEAEPRPLVTELVTANIETLHEVGADFRRAQVAALRAHGYTMEQIAELLGVTRQRISAILKSDTQD